MEKHTRIIGYGASRAAKYILGLAASTRKMHVLGEETFPKQLENDANPRYLSEKDLPSRKNVRVYKRQVEIFKEKQDKQRKSPPGSSRAGGGFARQKSSGVGVLDSADWNGDVQVPWEVPSSEETAENDESGAWLRGFKTMWEIFHDTGAFRYPASQKILWFLNKTQAEPLKIAEEMLSFAEAAKSFERMEKLGCNPETAALNTFLHVLCKAKETGQAEALLRLIKSKLEPNKISFSILINGWCKAGKLNRALKVFQWMTALCCADVVAYNTLLDAMCRTNKFDLAIGLLRKMSDENCDPDAITYNILIHRLCKAKKLELALKVYDTMIQQSVVVPNESTYSPLIQCLCNTGNLEVASKMLNEMRNAGLDVSVAIHNSFVKYFCKNRQMESALVVLAEMKKEGCDLKRETYHLVITTLCLENRLEKAWELWEDMKFQGCNAASDTYASLIQAFCCKGYLQKACGLLEEMVNKKLAPQTHTWNMFYSKCLKAGELETVDRLKNLIDKKNYSEIT